MVKKNQYSAAMPEAMFVLPETKLIAKMMIENNYKPRKEKFVKHKDKFI